MRTLLTDAAHRAIRYVENVNDRPVRPDPKAVAGLTRWDTPLQNDPIDPVHVLRELDEVGSSATMAMSGGRFFGFVIGGSVPASLAANWLATAWDQNTGLSTITPGTSEIERISLRWLLDVLHLPATAAGAFVTGATVANFTALAAARRTVLLKHAWDPDADGLFGAPPVTIIVGNEVHPTVMKAVGLLGFGKKRVVRVPVDGQGRLRADALPTIAGPTIVLAQAGNVNTGAVDPLRAIIRWARDAGAWVHVDGAFGLWAAAAPSRAFLVDGLELADSWATDAHKWLNVPFDSGLAFVRDGEALRGAMSVTAEYLPKTTEQRDPSDFTPELSRRARGVEVWAALRSLGRQGVAEMIERTCRHARRFAEGLRGAGFEVLNEVVLNQVLVSFGTPEQTQRTIARLQEEGTCWVGGTVWQGRTAMRISVSSWATTEEDVERSLRAMIACGNSSRGRV
ncbi:MAG: aminotransferase class V-fold PLP-dependent enzyme [Bacteroidetes bacterium]|jgi:glutamate/tyrosine decarboxylase-like PLP-dependent enzyme|nr:aminotransferase class V-fold PLP-dependent enzyme [Bacteroidota bacterium]